MNCQQCGSVLEPTDVFCQNCGAKNNNAIASTVTFKANDSDSTNTNVDNVKNFFRNSFMDIVKSIIIRPIEGTSNVFKQAGPEAYNHALILIITTGVVVFILPFLFFDKYLGNQGAGIFLKLGIVVCLILFFISILTYFIKGITGKPDFKRELLTGGICGIPIIIWIIYICFFGSSMLSGFDFMSNLSGIGLWSGLVGMYILFMLINIVQQSLKSAESNDAVSWYVSPLIIFLSFYIGIKIGSSLIGSGYGY